MAMDAAGMAGHGTIKSGRYTITNNFILVYSTQTAVLFQKQQPRTKPPGRQNWLLSISSFVDDFNRISNL
jgi:hypothetical protein